MNLDNPYIYLKDLFKRNTLLFKGSNYTYRSFYETALKVSKKHLVCTDQYISLCPENNETALIEILAIWIAKKTVILHAPGTPVETIQNYKDQILNQNISSSPIACYILTSGSTNGPKAIPLSFNNLFFAAKGFQKHFNLSTDHYLPITLPIYHVGGLMIFIRSVYVGAKVSIHSPGSILPEDLLDRPSFMSVVPLQLERIIDCPKSLKFFKDSIFIIGGAKTSLNTLNRIEQNNILASSSYGMTETCAMVMATEVTSSSKVLRTVGRPFHGVRLELSSESTLIIKSESVSPIISNGEVRTNDQVSVVDNNYIIEGRVDDIFISGGENINPAEIESAFISKGIDEAYIISVPDKKFGEKSILFYRSTISEADVIEISNNHLTPFKRPRHFFKIPEFSFSGIKVKKSTLKEIAPLYVKLEQAKSIFPLNYIGDPRRPWIVLLHGFMGDKHDWLQVGEELKNDFFTISIDLPGHGENHELGNCSLEEFQKDFFKFSKLLNHNFHLLGYSQGGRLALGLVLKGLEVQSLILESASLGIVDEEEREKRYKTDLSLFKNIKNSEDLESFLTYWYENPLFGDFKNLDSFGEILEYKKNYDWSLWQESLKSFSVGIQPDYRQELSRIKSLKALTICGEKDHKYLAASMEMKTKFGFNFIKIPSASHNTHAENPTIFSKEITKFLNS